MSRAVDVPKEQVLATLSVEQIYGGKIKLLPRDSSDHKALCPFHADSTPSLFIYGEKRFHCFGCGKDGSAFDFVMLMYGLDFPGAVAHLTALAGLPLNGKSRNGSGAAKSCLPERVVAAYDYVDEAGKLLYQVVRYEPKKFQQRRPDGKGGWIWNLDGVTRFGPFHTGWG